MSLHVSVPLLLAVALPTSAHDGGAAVQPTDGGNPSVRLEFCDPPSITETEMANAPKRVTPSGATLQFKVGERRLVRPPCEVKTLSVGNDPYDATFEKGMLLITAAEAGKDTLLGWCTNNKRFSYTIVITKDP
jgi:hypothetical protein